MFFKNIAEVLVRARDLEVIIKVTDDDNVVAQIADVEARGDTLLEALRKLDLKVKSRIDDVVDSLLSRNMN